MYLPCVNAARLAYDYRNLLYDASETTTVRTTEIRYRVMQSCVNIRTRVTREKLSTLYSTLFSVSEFE